MQILVGRHQRSCTDNGAAAHNSTVQNNGAHADQAAVFDGTGVQYRLVPYGHVVTDTQWHTAFGKLTVVGNV